MGQNLGVLRSKLQSLLIFLYGFFRAAHADEAAALHLQLLRQRSNAGIGLLRAVRSHHTQKFFSCLQMGECRGKISQRIGNFCIEVMVVILILIVRINALA